MITFEKMVMSKAHRILRMMSNYTKFDKANNNEQFDIPQLLNLDQVIGVYQNKSGSRVFITTEGLLISRIEPSDKFIRFVDMEKTISPPRNEKTTLSVVKVLLCNGERIEIPVEGHGEEVRHPDAWEFHRFMMRVVESYKKRQAINYFDGNLEDS